MDEKSALSNLRRIREVNWAEIEAEETRLLRRLTVEEGIRDYLALQAEFEPLLQETEALFRPEREARSIRLQERLSRLKVNGGSRVKKLAESLLKLQALLEEAGIPSAAIGGLAIGAWGEPRLTRDVDVKILLTREARQRLLDLLKPDYLFMHADPDQALRHHGVLFTHDSLGTRLDVFLTDTEHDELIIARARSIEILAGQKARICSPEDLIILKMVASRPQDWADVASVIQRQGDKLDEPYILEWLSKFEKAIDDSTLIREYRRIKERYHRSE